jgi:serine/threonine-protein kinase
MGELWRGYHHTLATNVAVKLLVGGYRTHPTMLTRFHMEAIAAARIKHPNVIQIHDHGLSEDGIAYIVMEYLPYDTLRARLDRHESLSLSQIVEVATQLADALDAIHRQGVVHRDVKPDNIALRETARTMHVTIFDFGVSSVPDLFEDTKLTEPGALVGTPAYMSLEQVEGSAIDHRTDLWALAVVVYELLTGKLPFDERSVPAACTAILAGAYAAPSRRRPELGPSVDAWFARSVAPDRESRYSSAAEMIRALSMALERSPSAEMIAIADKPTLPSAPPWVSTATPPSRRAWRQQVAMTAALASLLLTTMLSWSHGQDAAQAQAGIARSAALQSWLATHGAIAAVSTGARAARVAAPSSSPPDEAVPAAPPRRSAAPRASATARVGAVPAAADEPGDRASRWPGPTRKDLGF